MLNRARRASKLLAATAARASAVVLTVHLALSIGPTHATPIDVQAVVDAAAHSADASTALQAQIDAAGAGTIFEFPASALVLPTPVELKSGHIYRGTPGGSLLRANAKAGPILIIEDQSAIAVTGLTFVGGGLHIIGDVRDIKITGNTFRNIIDPAADYGDETGIHIGGPFSGGTIKHNTFERIGHQSATKNPQHVAALLGFHLDQTEIANNSFRDVYQGMNIVFKGAPHLGQNLYVHNNRIENAVRMGIEIQGEGTTGTRVADNFVTLSKRGDEDIAISIVLTGDTGTLISGNTAIRTNPTGTTKCAGMGIEAAGIDTLVTANRIEGNWCASVGVEASTTQFTRVNANSICGQKEEWPTIFFYYGAFKSSARDNVITKNC